MVQMILDIFNVDHKELVDGRSYSTWFMDQMKVLSACIKVTKQHKKNIKDI